MTYKRRGRPPKCSGESKYKIFHEQYISFNYPYRSSKEFLAYIVSKIIYEYYIRHLNEFPTKEYVLSEIYLFFGAGNLYFSGLNVFLNKYFTGHSICCSTHDATMPNSCIQAMSMINRIVDMIHHAEMLSDEEVITYLRKNTIESSTNTETLLAYSVVFDMRLNNKDMDFCLSNVYVSFANGNYELTSRIDKYISNVDEKYFDRKISDLTTDSSFLKICKETGLLTIKDVVFLSISSLLGLFGAHLDVLIKILNSLDSDVKIENLLSVVLANDFECINKEYENVLVQRLIDGKTLDEIGTDYKLTRERIRQVIISAKKKLLPSLRKNVDTYKMFFNELMSASFVEEANIYQEFYSDGKIRNRLILALFLLAEDNKDENCYTSAIKRLIEKGYINAKRSPNLKEYIKEFCKGHPYILVDDYNNLASIQKDAVNSNYKKFGNFYINQKYREGDILVYFCNTYFPSGIHVSSKDAVNTLRTHYHICFCNDLYPPTNYTSLSAMLIRGGYILSDRGTYRNKAFCPTLSQELVNNIAEFIYSRDESVTYYATIYDQFRQELNDIGVNNEWMLKGLLDEVLPTRFASHRDYIVNTSIWFNSTPKRELITYARSFNGIFTIDDLYKKFPGVQQSLFVNFLYLEENKNGLIALSEGRYIYNNNTNISYETKTTLDEFLDIFFSNYRYESINVSVIYSALKLQIPELLENLHEVGKSSFALFSFIKINHPYKYKYDRPYISTDFESKLTHIGRLLSFVADMDEFSQKDVVPFMNYNNIRDYYYPKLLDAAKETHIRVDEDRMIKKEDFVISDDDLEQIDATLNALTRNGREINTASFNGYLMFPTIKYKWNKYLLFGITATYLADKYETRYVSPVAIKTDFIIRRRNK